MPALRLPSADVTRPSRRIRGLGLAALVVAAMAGWWVLWLQHAQLWSRLTPAQIERFVADGVVSPLPAAPAIEDLQRLCAQAPTGGVFSGRRALRQKAADCAASVSLQARAEDLQAALAHYEARVQAQHDAAARWLAAHAAQAPALRETLALQLEAAQTLQWAPDASLKRSESSTVRTAPADELARRLAAAQRQHAAARALPAEERMVSLALAAHGLALRFDHGQVPARPYLVADRTSLAMGLKALRIGQGFAARGAGLADWRALPLALAVSATILGLAGWWAARGSARATALWAVTGLLLGAGSLLLADLSLTGDPALRHLLERQFVRFPVGDSALDLLGHLNVAGWELPFWWPSLVVAALLVMLRLVMDHLPVLLAPMQWWVGLAGTATGRAVLMGLLLLAGVAAVAAAGMAAAVSELLLALAVLGLATAMAGGAALANAGGRLGLPAWAVAGTALACALAGSVWRMDLGHAMVALAVAGTFGWLFGARGLRAVTLVSALGLIVVVGLVLASDQLPAAATAAVDNLLPSHARARIDAWLDPYAADTSDLARVRWLMASAGLGGWGPGLVPWSGLMAGRPADGLPLQGPSDYVLGLVAALWGRPVALAALGAVLATFVGAGALGLRAALQPGANEVRRLLAAVGGFGCLAMALKAFLSAAGVSGVLPLTGLPVALLGYGPVTLAAALGYLLLALGLAVAPPAAPRPGVYLKPPRPRQGAVSRRQTALAAALVIGVVVLLLAGEWRLAAGADEPAVRHLARERWLAADAVARALVPLPVSEVRPARCAALQSAVDSWNRKLAQRSSSAAGWQLDPARLPDAADVLPDGPACRALARRLGMMADEDFLRVVGRQPAVDPSAPLQDAALQTIRTPAARPMDYTTHNAWWGIPGCLSLADGVQPDCPGRPAAGSHAGLKTLDLDPWLSRDLMPRVHLALRQPTGTAVLQGRDVHSGPDLELALDARWQPAAQRIADCFAGLRKGPDCAAALPIDPNWRERHFERPGALRAGAVGIVLLEVDSGRIAALAAALSDCSVDAMRRRATAGADGQLPALRDGQPCAQWPDDRSAWLLSRHPALWNVPPGSALKPLAVAAGIDAGRVPAAQDAWWTGILAQSELREPVQALALAAGEIYLGQLRHAGFDNAEIDLLWGRPPGEGGTPGWAVQTAEGTNGLRPTSLSFAEMERIRRDKLAGLNVDRREGPAVMREFIAARRLADAALGGGDLRASALGLARYWRGLDLAARGQKGAALHLIGVTGEAPGVEETAMFSTVAAQRLLRITSGVSASAFGGTAQGSCRVVWGQCPAQGVQGLSGKTGTSDFLVRDGAAEVKPGQQLPAKLFGAVFSAPDGRRYAVGVMAMRVREPGSQTLELTPSAPAEAAFTLMRNMGVKP